MLQRILKYFRKDKPAEQYEHQPDDAIFTPKPAHPAMKAPIVRSGYVSSQNEPTYVKQEACQPEPIKIPRGWKKADGKTRHVAKGRVDVMGVSGIIYTNCKAKDLTTAWTEGCIIAYRECKPSEKRHTISDKKVSESAKKSSKNKGFSAKAKKQGSARKTVTVKKRVTK